MNESEIIFDALNNVYGNLPNVGIPCYGIILSCLVFLLVASYIWLMCTLMVNNSRKQTICATILFIIAGIGFPAIQEVQRNLKEKQFVELLMHDSDTLERVQELRGLVKSFDGK